jgi:hypothetical protein
VTAAIVVEDAVALLLRNRGGRRNVVAWRTFALLLFFWEGTDKDGQTLKYYLKN